MVSQTQNSKKIVLDLCGGTGSWSRPYKEAGYDVRNITLPEYDVRKLFIANGRGFFPPILRDKTDLEYQFYFNVKDIYGILAAPPCTMFSLARTTAKKPRDLNEGLEIVGHCMRIIWDIKPKFWALENLKVYLGSFWVNLHLHLTQVSLEKLTTNTLTYGVILMNPREAGTINATNLLIRIPENFQTFQQITKLIPI